MNGNYIFFGHENKTVSCVNEKFKKIENQFDLYDALSDIWCEYTCAPRLRSERSKDNKTLGQCSITAFLCQDIFGGEVYGILRPGGNYHCFNAINGIVFDLTSEQFGDEKLDYSNCKIQSREEHFNKKEKYERYLFLREKLLDHLNK